MRIRSRRFTRGHRPFATQGASLYVWAGSPDPGADAGVFRKLRCASRRTTNLSESSCGSAAGVAKTNRVDFIADPIAEFSYTIPVGYYSSTVYYQVRTCVDDVESEHNFRPTRTDLDGSGDDATEIVGLTQLLDYERRDGGVVRIRFAFTPSLDGLQPDTLKAVRTAGPTSPADVEITYEPGTRIFEIDTEELDNAGSYTFKIVGVSGATETDLLTGIAVTPDAAGPSAPINGSTSVW